MKKKTKYCVQSFFLIETETMQEAIENVKYIIDKGLESCHIIEADYHIPDNYTHEK